MHLNVDVRCEITGLLDKGFELAKDQLHDLLDMLKGGLMSLLIKMPVNQGKDWTDSFDSSSSLIIPQHLVSLQAGVHRLKQWVQNALIKEICMSAQATEMWV